MKSKLDSFLANNCHFLVFGRKINKKFISLNNLKVPEIIVDRCTGIDEEMFRDDISSTEIRLTNN